MTELSAIRSPDGGPRSASVSSCVTNFGKVRNVHVVLRSLGTAVPDLRISQEDAFQFLAAHFVMGEEQEGLYRRVMVEGPIRGRHFGMDKPEDTLSVDPDEHHARFLGFGRQLVAKAAAKALEDANVPAADVSALIVNTCTGYLCPGLTSYLCEDLGLSDDTRVLDIMGMGCGGALPNLHSGVDMLRAGLKGCALNVAVEICSSTFLMDDDPSLTISNAIFGDGAAAALLEAVEAPQAGDVMLVDFETVIMPRHRELLRYQHQSGRLRNKLSRKVPLVGAQTGALAVSRLLRRHHLVREDIQHWIVHAGGTAVLEQVARQMDLTKDQLRASYRVFEEFGNLSSPSVLFVLQEQLRARSPAAGEWIILLAFGAGFTAFAGLARAT